MQEAKLDHLKVLIVNLAFLHQELVLPDLPVEGLDEFPQKLMPRRSNVAASYQSTIASIIAQNPIPEEDEEEERVLVGMDGVEPEQGFMAWTQNLNDLVSFDYRSVEKLKSSGRRRKTAAKIESKSCTTKSSHCGCDWRWSRMRLTCSLT